MNKFENCQSRPFNNGSGGPKVGERENALLSLKLKPIFSKTTGKISFMSKLPYFYFFKVPAH